MDHTEEKLLPAPAEEPKLLDRPAEERLREQLEESRDGHKREEDKPSGPSRRTLWIIGAVVLLVLLLILLLGYLPRRSREREAASEARREQESLPIVSVMKVRRAPNASRLLLPGNMTPLTEAYIYARASGYVRRRYVDIGDRVRRGQVLADIEAPDLDQQVAQARASLEQSQQQLGQTRASLDQARAQLALAKVTWDRYKVLGVRGAVAQQDVDTQAANYKTSDAAVDQAAANVRAAEQNVRANQANVERLIALQQFEHVTAPFDGVITARNIDVGALISGGGAGMGASNTPMGGTDTSSQAGNSTLSSGTAPSTSLGGGASGGEMFREAQIDRLRILINVPEPDTPSMHAGQAAEIVAQAFPQRTFHGVVTRTASSLDLTTRTMLAEVQVDNPQRVLLPGMYAQLQLVSTRGTPPLLVPGDSLVTEANGIQVAILEDPDEQELKNAQERMKQADQKQNRQKPKRIHFQQVEVGRDYGNVTEIVSGLQGWEYIVVNPGDAVREGALVEASGAPPDVGRSQVGGRTEARPTTIGAETPGRAGQAVSGVGKGPGASNYSGMQQGQGGAAGNAGGGKGSQGGSGKSGSNQSSGQQKQ